MAKRRELEQTSFLYGGNSSFIEELYARYLDRSRPRSTRAGAPISTSSSREPGAVRARPRGPGAAAGAAAAGPGAAGSRTGGTALDETARQGADPRSSARDHADPRLSRARPSDRQARPAGPHPQRAASRARLPHLRLHRRRPRPRVLPRLRARPGEGHAAPDHGGPAARPTAARSASSSCTSRTPSRRPGSRRGSRARAACSAPRAEDKREILEQLTETEGFEQFLHVKFPGTKRFGLDGGESAIPALETIIRTAAELGGEEIVIGMPHRGRLNVLANVMGKPYAAILSEFQGKAVDRRGAGLGRRQVPSRHLDRPGAARRPARSTSRSPPTPRTSKRSTRW